MKDTFALQLSKSSAPNNKLRPAKRLSGTGTVTTGRGKVVSVEYHLCFAQNGEDADEEPSNAEIKSFTGQVWCPYDGSFVSVHLGKTLTLRIEDGRQLRFEHRNRDGGIVVTEWIG